MPRLTALVRSDQPLVQPLYQEVAAVIASEIESGALRRGALLPPERLMCEQLRVSRVTLRRALGILQHEGKVVPSHGRGWFVNDTRLSELPNVLQGFSDLVTGRRLRAGTRMLLSHVRAATFNEADELDIAPGAPLFELRRVRTIDGLPVAIDHGRIPLDVCPHLPEVDLESHSLYRTLGEHGVQPFRCDYVIEAIPAEPEHSVYLKVKVGSPLLLTEGTTRHRGGRPIELSSVVFIGGRYRFRASVYAQPNARHVRTPNHAEDEQGEEHDGPGTE